MSEIVDVYEYIKTNEPIEQSDVVRQFPEDGLSHLRALMIQNHILYTLDWKLTTDERGGHP